MVIASDKLSNKRMLQTQEQYSQVKTLIVLADLVSRHMRNDINELLEPMIKEISKTLDNKNVALHILDDETEILHLVQQAGDSLNTKWINVSIKQDSPMSDALHACKAMCRYMPEVGVVLCVPVVGAQLVIGCLSVVLNETPGLYPGHIMNFLTASGYLLGLAIEHTGLVNELVNSLEKMENLHRREAAQNRFLQSTNDSLRRMLISDPLTGLSNRRHILDFLNQEIARAQRTGRPFCVLMVDLDHFKSINDSLGHQVGDQALILLAEWLSKGVRRMDKVGRYGGEEFLIIITECILADGIKIAEKLCKTVESRSNIEPFAAKGGFTMSVGVCQFQLGMKMEDIIYGADQAMYSAKNAGRNRVEVAPFNKI